MFFKLFGWNGWNATECDAPICAPTSAPTSVPTSEPQQAMLRALECPVCLEPSAPLFMCVNGHNVCTDCRTDLASCPVCRVPGKPASHNIALDIISEQVLSAACENKPHGCNMTRRNAEGMKLHRDQCAFNYRCAVIGFSTCPFVGRLTELHDHLEKEHHLHIRSLGKEIRLTFPGITAYLLSIFKSEDRKEYFTNIIRYNSSQNTFYCFSRYVGPLKNADKFRIKIKLSSPVANSTLIECVKQPLSMRDAFENNVNTISLKQCFDRTPNGGITIQLTVGPIVELNSASTQC